MRLYIEPLLRMYMYVHTCNTHILRRPSIDTHTTRGLCAVSGVEREGCVLCLVLNERAVCCAWC